MVKKASCKAMKNMPPPESSDDEEWTNQRGKVGYEKTGDIYRPTKKINEKTPITWFELTPTQIKAAQNEKKNLKRVSNFSKL